MQSSSAAPTATAKTEIVAFEASPFPYCGQPPGQDKPFFDVEQDGRRGHTSARGGIYWEDTTYSDPRALLHIPKGFDPARPAVMVVYFHGNQATLERDVDKRQQVQRQVAQSGLNAVLVAPQFAVDALDSSAGRFYEPGAFRRFVEEACVRLAKLHGGRRAKAAFGALPVILVAYSGGYAPAVWAAHHGGIGDRLRGIILLDALYAEVDKFADWIARRESAVFLSAYSRSARDENLALQRLLTERGIDFATAFPTSRLASGSVTFSPRPRMSSMATSSPRPGLTTPSKPRWREFRASPARAPRRRQAASIRAANQRNASSRATAGGVPQAPRGRPKRRRPWPNNVDGVNGPPSGMRQSSREWRGKGPVPAPGTRRKTSGTSSRQGAHLMAHDDRIDRTALTFVVVMLIFILTLAYVIFPRHDAPSGSSPSMSGSGPSSPGTAAPPQKK